MQNKNIIKSMAISAIFIALIAIMTFVPYVGFITVGVISITIIHVVVLAAALIFGWKQGLITGIAFGLCSLIKASTMPVSSMDFLFVNPLISVLPRAIFGFLSGLIFQTLKKNIKNIGLRSTLYVVTAVAMTALHTVMVLTMFYLFFDPASFGTNFKAVLATLITLNCAIEMALAGVVVPLIALAVSAAKPSLSAYSNNTNK